MDDREGIKQVIEIAKKTFYSSEYRNLFKNFSFLGIVQLCNYILPLITLPYLVNVLGPESFGHVMFAQAFTQYFVTLVDYGFNFSATRQIAISKDNGEIVSRIFCAVMVLKIFFFLASTAILVILVFAFEKFSRFPIIYFLTFSSVIGSVLFPSWLFQGIEKMKYITLVNVSSKILSTFCIFIFVHKQDQFLTVPLISSISSILPSILSLFYLRKIYPIVLIFPSMDELFVQLKKGWTIFLTSISGSMYSVSNTFLLGILFNDIYAGYYSFAEKIVRACTSLFVPLNNALFPFMSLKMDKSPAQGLRFFKGIFVLCFFVSFLGMIILFLGSDLLVSIIDSDFYPSIAILKVLSPLLIIVGINNLIGFQILYTSGQERRFLITVFIAGLLNLLFCFMLSKQFLYFSAAISLLLSEGFVCICFLFFSIKILKKNA